MQIQLVRGINWQGGSLNAFVVLEDGPLSNESIVVAPSLFLIEEAKHTSSLDTLRALASDIKFYFEALRYSNRKWEDVTDSDMSGYIESTLVESRGLGKESIGRHCSTIKKYYRYATNYGLTTKEFDYSFTYKSEEYKTTQQGNKKRKINFKLHEKYINHCLFETLLSNANESAGFYRSRDELILEMGYHAGLRTFEVTNQKNLKLTDLKTLINHSNDTNKLSITTKIYGKGKKVRSVDFTPHLTSKIEIFLKNHRENIPGDSLFCDISGKTLSKSFASRLFNRTKKASIPEIKKELKKLEKLEDAPYTISLEDTLRLTFHCLRHTYTTNLVTYCYQNNIDPYSYVPNQLGHGDKETTEHYVNFEASIYIRDGLRKKFSVIESTRNEK